MGKATGFLEIKRKDRTYEAPEARVQNFREFIIPLNGEELRDQAARCMDCGVPYCHNGCPVNNQIPDWNDLVYEDDWQSALANLHSTNNFPEFTGRICPAPCEAACTLNIDDSPVTIKSIECAIIDKGWENGWIAAETPAEKTGKSIAIIGAGPAGMAAAQQLGRRGHNVHVYEKHAKAGGLLRYGIPDFKMEKHLIDRRVTQLEAEGVVFYYNTNVGVDVTASELAEKHDALIVCGGSEVPRDLPVDGRLLDGVHFAMDFLPQQNRRVGQEPIGDLAPILAEDKHVIVIGGGDTGSDCIGTSFRQGAASVTQLEIMPMPPEKENKGLTWPDWPLRMRTSTSQEEGAIRDFSVMTTSIQGEDGHVSAISCTKVDENMQPIAGSEFELKADLVLLAMGFVHPIHEGMLDELSLERDGRGNVAADTATYQTSSPNVFACGDMRRGQSLVVWAIREGRQCAREVDLALMGETRLPR
ncbi:MAG: glutamate synthase [Rhizobiales bacterium TMED143]|nr:glutamate synthase [Rhodobiaceae bacterium]OUV93444.1 MAG: glutamate synthase [Rhizobiales bacterium TMED143]CAI8420091.1 MAG: Glutamate synthase [NADPH] small chain [Rhodobiaceae bacterium UBA7378]HCQ82841.1 glutamate synthase [Rhodobiaceae bacterium]